MWRGGCIRRSDVCGGEGGRGGCMRRRSDVCGGEGA